MSFHGQGTFCDESVEVNKSAKRIGNETDRIPFSAAPLRSTHPAKTNRTPLLAQSSHEHLRLSLRRTEGACDHELIRLAPDGFRLAVKVRPPFFSPIRDPTDTRTVKASQSPGCLD
jgi:hypothetical protein